MKTKVLYDGIVIIEDLGINHKDLFKEIKVRSTWDESIKSRKTVSYGIPYNYSQITYKTTKFPKHIANLAKSVKTIIGFNPNNCLVNFYEFNESKMGFHSDQIDILEPHTGIVIFSLGASRIMRFKNKDDGKTFDIKMKPDSLCYMTQDLQKKWLHSILPSNQSIKSERISLLLEILQNCNEYLKT